MNTIETAPLSSPIAVPINVALDRDVMWNSVDVIEKSRLRWAFYRMFRENNINILEIDKILAINITMSAKVVYAEMLLEYFGVRKGELRTRSVTQEIERFMPFLLSTIDVWSSIEEYNKNLGNIEYRETFDREVPNIPDAVVDSFIYPYKTNEDNKPVDAVVKKKWRPKGSRNLTKGKHSKPRKRNNAPKSRLWSINWDKKGI